MLGMMTRRAEPIHPGQSAVRAGLAEMIRSSRAHAKSRLSTEATVVLVLPEAGLVAGRTRLRPVLMTALASLTAQAGRDPA